MTPPPPFAEGRRIVGFGRIAAGGLMVAVLVYGYALRIAAGEANPFDYLGYFTNLTSLLSAVVLIVAGVLAAGGRRIPDALTAARAVATACLLIVAVVYNVIVPGTGSAPPAVSLALHGLFPLLVALDWLLVGDRDPLPWRRLWIVLPYPVLWLAVVRVRGVTDGWVPYGFLLPTRGVGPLLATVAGLLAALLAAAVLVWAASRFRGAVPWRGAPVRGRAPFAVTVLVGIPFAVALVWPQAYGMQRMLGVAQPLAFRGWLALGLAALAAVAAAVAMLRRRWAVAAGLAVVLTAAALGNGAVLLARGIDGTPTGGGELTVAVWNTRGGAATPASIARLVSETGAVVVSLPETDAQAAAQVVALLAGQGRRMSADTVFGDSTIPTSVLIDESLGDYRRDEAAGSTPGLPSGVWRAVDGRGPTIVAAHPLPPLPADMDGWRTGLEWIAARCDEPGVIIAGDLNATVDHLAGQGRDGGLIGECRDTAAAAGAAGAGTWPTSLPPALSAPIDHVLAGPAWRVRSVEVLTAFDDAGSDHRPIVARLDAARVSGGAE